MVTCGPDLPDTGLDTGLVL